jgi:formylglycine-generating enzyme required for sulfatase activity
MEFVLIPAKSFTTGADKNIEAAVDYETPSYLARVGKPFYLGKYEVTQEQWVAMMENNPSEFKGRTNPVENVSWDDVHAFIRRLNAKEKHDRYRLPTESEWEYAARTGTRGAYPFDDDADSLGHYAWYEDNSEEKTHPVGQKKANAWGLCDMHGNVWEWVQDWYRGWYDSHSPGMYPQDLSSGWYRVFCGGSWRSSADLCSSAVSGNISPGYRCSSLGFRLALSPELQAGGTGGMTEARLSP